MHPHPQQGVIEEEAMKEGAREESTVSDVETDLFIGLCAAGRGRPIPMHNFV